MKANSDTRNVFKILFTYEIIRDLLKNLEYFIFQFFSQ